VVNERLFILMGRLKRVLSIVGTRPEAIKMAPVIRALAAEKSLETRLCLTAQQREMLDQVLSVFCLDAEYDLDLMRTRQSLTEVTSRVLEAVGGVIEGFAPDLVLVHGDTTTAFASALAAFYRRVPVGHVEAGLRTGDIYSPWPEEMNRKLVGAITAWHFAPTERAASNLRAEGVNPAQIVVTGNTVVDALLATRNALEADQAMLATLGERFSFLEPARRLVLVTGHRRENFGAGIDDMCSALLRLAARGDIDILYPVHLNPSVLEPVRRHLGGNPRIRLIEPVDYLAFVYLMNRCHIVVTDSGGIQEEAPSLGKPVLVMRDTTERPEAVEAGTVRLVGTNPDRIVEECSALLDSAERYREMSLAHNPYGDGRASTRIVRKIVDEICS
jgi:UDP-N-acetylglucosamine 2-epimerase (non-hydrolysing)